MKQAIKFGFGFALGTYLFGLSKAVVDLTIDKCFAKKLANDEGFCERVKVMSPKLYAKYRKDNKQ